MASPSFDIRLVPEFNGDGDVVDWLEKVDMVCELQTPPADQLVVIPLRLRGGASAVYRQLTSDDRKDLDKVKGALKRAFAATSLRLSRHSSSENCGKVSLSTSSSPICSSFLHSSEDSAMKVWPARWCQACPILSNRSSEQEPTWNRCLYLKSQSAPESFFVRTGTCRVFPLESDRYSRVQNEVPLLFIGRTGPGSALAAAAWYC